MDTQFLGYELFDAVSDSSQQAKNILSGLKELKITSCFIKKDVQYENWENFDYLNVINYLKYDYI